MELDYTKVSYYKELNKNNTRRLKGLKKAKLLEIR